jgi:hypothetical protein
MKNKFEINLSSLFPQRKYNEYSFEMHILPYISIYRTKTTYKDNIFNNYVAISLGWLFWSACLIINLEK